MIRQLQKERYGLGIGLMGASSFFLTVLALLFDGRLFETPIRPELAVFGVFSLAVGVAGLAIILRTYLRNLTVGRADRFQEKYLDRVASRDEVPIIHEAMLRELGPNILDLPTRQSIFDKNPECFRIIANRRTGTIEACYIIVPVGRPAWRDILDSKRTGGQLNADDILKSFRRPAGVYISYADGTLNRGAKTPLVWHLWQKLEEYRSDCATLPSNPGSLNLVTGRGFRSLDQSDPQIGKVCHASFETLQSVDENRGVKRRLPRLFDLRK